MVTKQPVIVMSALYLQFSAFFILTFKRSEGLAREV